MSVAKLFLVSVLFIFSGVSSLSAQDDFGELFDDGVTQLWFPAPPPPGGLDWNVLLNVEVNEEVVDNITQFVPSFPAPVKALDKTTVKLSGYMIPLEASERQSHFILQAFPHSCPFHLAGGPGGYVEVKADIPIPHSYDPVFIEGHFQVLTDFSDGVFYRITAARLVEAE